MHTSFAIKFIPDTPKYLCVVDSIIEAIRDGELQRGQQLPSINELSERHLLARDTVEKAYKELRRRGIITSVKGKGYFINRVDVYAPLRVLLVFNKISNYKRQIYNAFVHTLGGMAKVDLHIHHSNVQVFQQLLDNNIGAYDYYVVMPHFYERQEEVIALLRRIPAPQLLLLDKKLPELWDKEVASVYQDFEKDIYAALNEAIGQLRKYERLVYVNPNLVPYPSEIRKGFEYFCRMNDFAYSVLEGMDADTAVKAGDVYVVIEETDLVNLIKLSHIRKWEVGRDIGIISYNETPLKEILLEGITVISTDHEHMGKTAARLILEKRQEQIKNPFILIRRNSL
ncbi:GntR family transcriptional regulator [Compostibacter hankyongensis]|uniref:GntR family transcriptional regulator n=1 Tax=Compostibacter hankyongensis TaxID=1007089 RepID=A0ABP8FFM2_9BACT